VISQYVVASPLVLISVRFSLRASTEVCNRTSTHLVIGPLYFSAWTAPAARSPLPGSNYPLPVIYKIFSSKPLNRTPRIIQRLPAAGRTTRGTRVVTRVLPHSQKKPEAKKQTRSYLSHRVVGKVSRSMHTFHHEQALLSESRNLTCTFTYNKAQITPGINLYLTARAHSSHSFPNSFCKTLSSVSALHMNTYVPRAIPNANTIINFLVESAPR